MNRVLCLLVLLGVAITMATAQSATATSATGVDKIIDGKFLALSAGLLGSTAFDVETTFRGLARCSCYEANPIVAPIVGAGRPATYAFAAGLDGVAVYSTFRLKRMHSKIWWLPATAVIGMHVWLGAHNTQLLRK